VALALLVLIVFIALMCEAMVGFGATIVTVALGAFLLPIDDLLAAYVPVNMLLSAYLVARYWRQIDVRVLFLGIVPAMTVGVVLGRFVTRLAGNEQLKLAFGVFVIVVSLLEIVRMLRKAGVERPLHPVPAGVLLVLGGIVHGLFGSGGPMAVYVSSRRIHDKGRFRATLSALWFVLNGMLVADFVATGTLGAASARRSALLLVPLLAGLAAGEWLHHRVPQRVFRGLLFVLLLVAGVLLAVGG